MKSVAIIGIGPHGQRMVKALGEITGAVLAAVVDKSESALAKAELPSTTKRLTSTAELFRSVRPDVVCIATNGPSHLPLTLEALENGVKRVLIEKPMGCSVLECDQIVDAANKYGARVSVDQIRRGDAAYLWTREQIRKGVFGTPRTVWIQRPGQGLGCVGTHSFDLVRFLIDDDVARVTAWLTPQLKANPRGPQFDDPSGMVVLETKRGVRACVVQNEDGAGPMSVEVDFDAGRIRIDEKNQELELYALDQSVKPGPGVARAYAKISPPADAAMRGDLHPMLVGVIRDLLDDGALECKMEHGRAAVEILAAAHLSHRRGNIPVALPLDDEGRALWMPIT